MPTQRQEKQSTKSDMAGKGGLIEGVSMKKEFTDVEFFRGAER